MHQDSNNDDGGMTNAIRDEVMQLVDDDAAVVTWSRACGQEEIREAREVMEYRLEDVAKWSVDVVHIVRDLSREKEANMTVLAPY